MKTEDARRKIALLRKISTDSGAAAAEKETAYRLQKRLMERYGVEAEDVPRPSQSTILNLTWTYWQDLLDGFGLHLNHFGTRGNAMVGNSKLHIALATNQWSVEEKAPGGWRITARDRGVESLRKYLKEHAPKNYSFLKR
jgi:hypothetical protein